MGAWIVIAVIALFLTFLFLIPIKAFVYFRYNDAPELEYELRYGFIKIKLPERGKVSKKAEDMPEKPPQEEHTETRKESDTKNITVFIWNERGRIKRMLTSVLGYISKHAIKINKLKIKLVIGFDDAMQTALIYGGACAAVFNFAGFMDRNMRLGSHSINLKPVFGEPHVFTEDEAVISTCILNIIILAMIALRYFIPILWKFRRSNRQVKDARAYKSQTVQRGVSDINGKSD